MFTTKNWEAFVFEGVGSKHPVAPLPITEDIATVVEVRRRDRDDDGEGYEGDWGNTWVIFQVGNRFFKKTFSESSFNEYDLYFSDEVEEVYGTVETTIAFRPKGN